MSTSVDQRSDLERLQRDNATLRAENVTLRDEAAHLRQQLQEAVEDAERAQQQCEVLENFCFGLEREYEQIRVTRDAFIALEEEAAKTREQYEVLENVCFGLEQEHERARQAVEDARRELASNYRALQALKEQQDDILNNVGQGIITVSLTDGFRINPESSRRAREILGDDLAGRSFLELFADDEARHGKLERLLNLLATSPWVSDSMIDRLNPLAEIAYRRSGDEDARALAFHFVRMSTTVDRSLGDAKVMVVFDDKTAERRLEQALQTQLEEYTAKIERIYRLSTLSRAAFQSFADDATVLVRGLEQMLESCANHRGLPDVAGLLRSAHTLKGQTRALGLAELTALTHELENSLESLRQSDATPDTIETIRGLQQKLARELEDSRAIVSRVTHIDVSLARERGGSTDEVERMLRRLVAQTASDMGKSVELHYRNELRAPSQVLRRTLQTILVHMVNNAIVHGIEAEPQRRARCKPSKGQIEIEVRASDDGVRLRCLDDGAGLDAAAIREVAVERGVIEPANAHRLDADQVHQLIFRPGVTTARTTTPAAGRGIGMDAVFDAVRSLGGTMEVRSEAGRFTEFAAWFPQPSTGEHS